MVYTEDSKSSVARHVGSSNFQDIESSQTLHKHLFVHTPFQNVCVFVRIGD